MNLKPVLLFLLGVVIANLALHRKAPVEFGGDWFAVHPNGGGV